MRLLALLILLAASCQPIVLEISTPVKVLIDCDSVTVEPDAPDALDGIEQLGD